MVELSGIVESHTAHRVVFLVFTVLATLGTGEHYVIDLIVAFPFAIMVQALSAYSLSLREGERRASLLFGIFVTLFWLASLSFAIPLFWIHPVVPWSLTLATVALTCWFEYRLHTFAAGPVATLTYAPQARPLSAAGALN